MLEHGHELVANLTEPQRQLLVNATREVSARRPAPKLPGCGRIRPPRTPQVVSESMRRAVARPDAIVGALLDPDV